MRAMRGFGRTGVGGRSSLASWSGIWATFLAAVLLPSSVGAQDQDTPERWQVLRAVVAEVRSSGMPTEKLAVDSSLYDASDKVGRWWKAGTIPHTVLGDLGVMGIDDLDSVVSCPDLPSSCVFREGITTALAISVPQISNGRASVVVRTRSRTESTRTPVAAQIFELFLVKSEGTWCATEKVVLSFT